MALEASKNQAEEDRKRQSQNNGSADDDLAKAIRLSKEEDERRQRELDQMNANSLFDDIPVQPAQPQAQQPLQYQQTAFQPDYQQGQMVDFWGNPINQQSTGYLNGVYAQPTGQYTNQQYPQPTGFDMQQAMQQQQQQQQQQGYMAPLPAQPTGYNQNPYGNGNGLSPQQTAYLAPGNNNPYANGLQPQQPLQPLPTGSNNPFAPKMNYGTQSPPRTSANPSLATLAEQRTATANNQFSQFQQQSQQTPFNQSSTSSTPAPQKPVDPQRAHLEALIATGNGLDTFGNTGETRMPAQHTAPGMFVNSAGLRRNMPNQQTGNNPWLQQTQFTGVPQSTGFGASLQAPAQQQRLVPAHTGPAGMNSYQSSNPFGQPQQYQQQQQNQNLIDF
jgi:epsin